MKKIIVLVFIVSSCCRSNAQVIEDTDSQIEKVEMAVESKAPKDIPFSIIENAPIFPGCTGNKSQIKQCLNKSVQNHVYKNFKVKRVKRLKLSPGKKRIYIRFKIDKNGNITNILARGPHKKAEQEGIRVVKLLPKMIPGKQRGKNVNVTYMLPISFNVE